MTISIHSFDFDGCLSRRWASRNIIEANQELLDKIVDDTKKKNTTTKEVKHTYIVVGSARQSKALDDTNAITNRNGSCFVQISQIADHLKSKLDNNVTFVPFLMADLYGDLKPGTSLERIMNSEENATLEHKLDVAANILFKIATSYKYPPEVFKLDIGSQITFDSLRQNLKKIAANSEHSTALFYGHVLFDINANLKTAGCNGDLYTLYFNEFEDNHCQSYYDDSKVTILYAQMHERAAALAEQYPNENFEFNFYDDRADILEKLNTFYTQFSHLIPENMKLQLHHYEGTPKEPKYQISITGQGSVDKTWVQTVKNMTAIAKTGPASKFDEKIDVAKSEKLLPLLRKMPRDNTFAATFNHHQNNPSAAECKTENSELSPKTIPSTVPTPTGLTPGTVIKSQSEAVNTGITSSQSLSEAETVFKKALQTIQTKSKSLNDTYELLFESLRDKEVIPKTIQSYQDAYYEADALYGTVNKAWELFKTKGNKVLFETSATEAINKALGPESELNNHRGWKEVIGYLALAVLAVVSVATAGAAYLIAGAFNYAINRQFFFSATINTDSVNKVHDLRKALGPVLAMQQ